MWWHVEILVNSFCAALQQDMPKVRLTWDEPQVTRLPSLHSLSHSCPSLTSCQTLLIQTSCMRPRLCSKPWPWQPVCAKGHAIPYSANLHLVGEGAVQFWLWSFKKKVPLCSLYTREKHSCLSCVAFMWGLAEEQVAQVNLSAQNKMALLSAQTRGFWQK